jgi:hypothetical protein
VIDDPRWERVPRVADAVRWGWASSVGKLGGEAGGLGVMDCGEGEGADRDPALAERRTVEGGVSDRVAWASPAAWAATRVRPVG